jgi:hypothetical protein
MSELAEDTRTTGANATEKCAARLYYFCLGAEYMC